MSSVARAKFHANMARIRRTFNPIHRVSRMFFVCRSSHVGDFESPLLRRKCVGCWHRDQSDFAQLVTSANERARCHAIPVHALHLLRTRIKSRTWSSDLRKRSCVGNFEINEWDMILEFCRTQKKQDSRLTFPAANWGLYFTNRKKNRESEP